MQSSLIPTRLCWKQWHWDRLFSEYFDLLFINYLSTSVPFAFIPSYVLRLHNRPVSGCSTEGHPLDPPPRNKVYQYEAEHTLLKKRTKLSRLLFINTWLLQHKIYGSFPYRNFYLLVVWWDKCKISQNTHGHTWTHTHTHTHMVSCIYKRIIRCQTYFIYQL